MSENGSPYLSGGCPELGVALDPDTRLAFPSPANLCHCAEPAQSVPLHQQQSFCLSDQYPQCPVYSACGLVGNWEGPLPFDADPQLSPEEEVAALEETRRRRRAQLGWYSLALVIVLALLGLLVAGNRGLVDTQSLLGGIFGPPAATRAATPEAPQVALAAAVSPTATQPAPSATPLPPTATPTFSPSPSPSPTASLTPSPTAASPTPGPELGQRFGPNNRFLLYEVQEGEYLAMIARRFDTTVRVLQAANDFGSVLKPGTVLLVMPGEMDHTHIQTYQLLFLEQPARLSEIAAQSGVPLETLRQLNQIGSQDELTAEKWLIVPVTK